MESSNETDVQELIGLHNLDVLWEKYLYEQFDRFTETNDYSFCQV